MQKGCPWVPNESQHTAMTGTWGNRPASAWFLWCLWCFQNLSNGLVRLVLKNPSDKTEHGRFPDIENSDPGASTASFSHAPWNHGNLMKPSPSMLVPIWCSVVVTYCNQGYPQSYNIKQDSNMKTCSIISATTLGKKPFLIHREYTIITTHRDINYHLKVSKFTGSLYVSIISSIQASQPPQAVSAATRPAEPSENGRDHWFAWEKSQSKNVALHIKSYTIWIFNIAMENPL